MTEFEIGGVQYRAATMDARRQFHVARRLSMLFKAPASALQSLNVKTNDGTAEAITGFFDAIAEMPDRDLDYVIDACLDTVSRKDGGAWTALRRDGVLMYELDLYTQGAIVYHVIKAALAGFFASLPSDTRTAAEAILGKAMGKAVATGD